ncbi:hypothetical protein ES705_16280 [subsurface metagenome]
MITVTQERDSVYTIQLEISDMAMLEKIAFGMGISKSTTIVSCMNKGLAVYTTMLQEIAQREKRKREANKQNNDT